MCILAGALRGGFAVLPKSLRKQCAQLEAGKELDLPPNVSILSPELLLTTLKAQSQTLFTR
jgi:hypothetical protein